MLASVWQRLDQAARLALPLLTTFLFIMISVFPWPLPYLGAIAPSLGLIAVYYWAVHRPDLFRPGAAFVLGLFYDWVNFLPLGLSALIFVGVRQLVLSQRRFFVGHSFFMLWSGFALMILLSMAGYWLILSLYNWNVMSIAPLLLQTILTIVVFPLPAWMLIRLQRAVWAQV